MAPNPEMVKSTAIARTNSFFGASPGTDVDHGNHFPQDSLKYFKTGEKWIGVTSWLREQGTALQHCSSHLRLLSLASPDPVSTLERSHVIGRASITWKRTPTPIPIHIRWLIRGDYFPSTPNIAFFANTHSTLPNPTRNSTKRRIGVYPAQSARYWTNS